jgi:membrane-associated phospholipid phosphatase
MSVLRITPRLRRRDIALTLIPLGLWLLTLYSRPLFIHPSCSAQAPCQASQVFFLDRPSIGIVSGNADFYSYVAQNSTAALAAGGPVLYQTALLALGRASLPAAAAAAGTDLVIFAQTWLINGFFNESARIVAGRARPYLYAAPGSPPVDSLLFSDPQNYTSFYSGHTSFVTAAWVFLLLTMAGRGASRRWLLATGLIAQCWIVSTGVFRILAGRHFLTDVLVAIVMGTLMALCVARLHRTPIVKNP